MNNRQWDLIDAAKSGIAFTSGLKNPPPRVTEARKRLEEALRDTREVEVKQFGAKHARKKPRYSVNRAKTILLRKHLDPIAADGLEMFSGLPGIEDTLRLPRIKDDPERHLEAATRVRRIAEQHEQEFIGGRNYEVSFLQDFDAAVQDLDAAARIERGSARANYSRATAAVKEQMSHLRRVFDALDTRMREAYLDDHAILKLWRHASRRLRAKIGRPKKRKAGRQKVARG